MDQKDRDRPNPRPPWFKSRFIGLRDSQTNELALSTVYGMPSSRLAQSKEQTSSISVREKTFDAAAPDCQSIFSGFSTSAVKSMDYTRSWPQTGQTMAYALQTFSQMDC